MDFFWISAHYFLISIYGEHAQFLYMAVVLYSPSLAVQQVTGIPLWISIFLTGLVCTMYTSLGGMRAVVFTDTFQVFVMFAGNFVIICILYAICLIIQLFVCFF